MKQDVVDEVMRREQACIAFLHDPTHECKDAFGRPHSPYAKFRLTLEHVHLHAGGTKGRKAPDDPHHLVLICGWLNGGGGGVASRALREYQREHLRRVAPIEDVA